MPAPITIDSDDLTGAKNEIRYALLLLGSTTEKLRKLMKVKASYAVKDFNHLLIQADADLREAVETLGSARV